MRRAATAALLIATLAGIAAAAPARGAAGPWMLNGPSRLRLLSPYLAAPAGDVRLGLEFRTAPGWHVYWKNSGDAGYPPTVQWSGDGLAAGSRPELLWPAPRRFELAGGLVAFGYEGEVIYPVRARLAAGAPGAVQIHTAHLAADVDYLICQVDCIPFRSRLSLEQPVAAAAVADPATAPAIEGWWSRLPAPVATLPGAAAALRYDPAGPALDLSIRAAGGVTAGPGADLFFEPQELFDVARPQARSRAGGVDFHVPLARRQVNRPLPTTAPFTWTATGLRGARGPLALEGRSQVALAPPAPGSTRPAAGARPLARDLLAALAAGLLLTLAPAPLALLLSRAAALRGHAGGRIEARVAALAGAAGLASGAWSTAAAARAGAFAGWGTPLGRPAWTGGLAALALLLALDLWGMVAAPAPAGSGEIGGDAEASPAARAFLAGLATPLLALGWPLPPALRVDLAARGALAAALLATAVALGLALPYAAHAAYATAEGRRGEPARSSPPWREALGFLAAAGAVWLLYRLSREVRPEGLAAVELALLGAALLAWVRRRVRRRSLRRTLAAVALACALAVPFVAAGWR